MYKIAHSHKLRLLFIIRTCTFSCNVLKVVLIVEETNHAPSACLVHNYHNYYNNNYYNYYCTV